MLFPLPFKVILPGCSSLSMLDFHHWSVLCHFVTIWSTVILNYMTVTRKVPDVFRWWTTISCQKEKNKVATLIFCWVNLFISALQNASFKAEKWHVSSPRIFAILKSSPFCAQPGLKNLVGVELLKVLMLIFSPALLPSHSWLFSTCLPGLCRAPSANVSKDYTGCK